jgi:hypothetical protein
MGFIIVAILIAAFIVGVVLFLCWASNVDVNK